MTPRSLSFRLILPALGLCFTAGLAVAPSKAGEKSQTAAQKRPASQERRWSTPREASDGPTLDSAWFAERKVVVYLIPPGGLPAARQAAAAVMKDRWTAGDWSVKHVFVGGVPHAALFTIGKKIGLRDAAREVTHAAGQGDEFLEENEKLVSDHIFFVHDPKRAIWAELLGKAPDVNSRSAVVLLDRGRVVGSIDTAGLGAAPVSAGPDDDKATKRIEALAGEVRRLLVGQEVASREPTDGSGG